MAALGHIDDGFFPLRRGWTRCSRSAFISPAQGQAEVLVHPSPVKSLNHVSSGRAITPTPLTQELLLQIPDFCSVQHIDADYYFFFLLQIIYNCDSFKHICQIFISHLGLCKCGGK